MKRRRLAPDARREEILAAAERLLRRDATADVRVDDVVREARAAKGTFYLYFESWEELLLALRERAFARFDELYPSPAHPAAIADWRRLAEKMAVGFVDFTLSLGGLHRAIFHGALEPLPAHGGAIGRIADLIDAGMKAGAFAETDARLVARFLFAMLHEAVDAIEAGENRARVLRTVRQMLARCLAPESSA